VIVPNLDGLKYDLETPTLYRSYFQCLIRTPSLQKAHAYGSEAIQHLHIYDVDLGGCYLKQSVPSYTPVVYPASDGDLYEASVTFDFMLIDERIYTVASTAPPGSQTPLVAIWYSAALDSILVGGEDDTYPAKSLEAVQIGDLVKVINPTSGGVVAGPKHFSKYTNEVGDTFATVAEVVQYLTEEFSKKTAATGLSYEHTQSTPADEWTVTHNFGAYPSNINVYVNDVLVMAGTEHVDPNTLKIVFLAPQVGTVSVAL